jgi:hypothetical protein
MLSRNYTFKYGTCHYETECSVNLYSQARMQFFNIIYGINNMNTESQKEIFIYLFYSIIIFHLKEQI